MGPLSDLSRTAVFLLLGLLAFVNLVCAGGGNEWGYEGPHSPETWHEDFPRCGGKKQSPINIVTDEVILNQRLGPLDLVGYHQILENPLLVNNGHSAVVPIQKDLYIVGGGLPSRYKAVQFHFHWGDADRRGSEHSVNSEGFPMEMHIVHYSTDYANFSEAVNKPDGLAVLGVFLQVGEIEHPGFQHIVSHFEAPIHKDERIEMESLSLDSMMPADTKTYYRYSGSLTTPPCFESVVWTLYPDYIFVTEEQVNKFRRYLKSNPASDAKEVSLVNDYRPQQPINVRLVQTNTLSGLGGTGSYVSASVQHLVVSLIPFFYLNLL